MNTLLVWLIMLLALAGCRAPIREMGNQERRYLEDKAFHLESLVEEYETRLDSCHHENEALLKELAREGGVPAKRRRGSPAPRDEEFVPPTIESGEARVRPYRGPPVISPPDPDVPEGEHIVVKESASAADDGDDDGDEVAIGDDASGDAAGGALGAGGSLAGPVIGRPAGGDPVNAAEAGNIDDPVVSQISLNRKLTGGHNVDGQPGDEGMMVVVEPLNAAGELLEVPGEVSIVVLDPALEGEQARVARWDFTSRESADHLQRTPMGDGLHFDLRWPHSAPTHRLLNLYVRYTTADGRQLQLEKQVEIDPPGGVSDDSPGGGELDERWTRLPADNLAHDAPAEKPPAEAERAARSGQPGGKPARGASRGPRWAPYR